MIGLDTNVLLHLWLNDDPAQAPRVEALVSEHGQGIGSLLVTDVVLDEALWVLASAYEQDKAAQLAAVTACWTSPRFASRTAMQSRWRPTCSRKRRAGSRTA